MPVALPQASIPFAASVKPLVTEDHPRAKEAEEKALEAATEQVGAKEAVPTAQDGGLGEARAKEAKVCSSEPKMPEIAVNLAIRPSSADRSKSPISAHLQLRAKIFNWSAMKAGDNLLSIIKHGVLHDWSPPHLSIVSRLRPISELVDCGTLVQEYQDLGAIPEVPRRYA